MSFRQQHPKDRPGGSRKLATLTLLQNFTDVINHQNVTGFVATYLYSLSGTTLTYTGQGGKNTFMVPNNSNNSGFLYTPRQIEIIGRFTF